MRPNRHPRAHPIRPSLHVGPTFPADLRSPTGLVCICLGLLTVAPMMGSLTPASSDSAAHHLRAQEAAGARTVTLDEAVRLLHENSPEMALARARVREAAGFERQSEAFLNPSVGATYETLSGDGADASETYVTLTQPFEWPGRRSARSRAGDHRYEEARARFRADSAALVYEVRRTYLQAAASNGWLAVLEDVASVFREAAERAETRFLDGDASRYEMDRIRLERLRYERSLSAARIEASAAREALAALILPEGDSGREETVVTEGLPPGLPPAVGAGANLADGVEDHPTVVAARAAVEATRAQVDLAKTLRYPDPALTAGYKTQSDDRDGIFLGVSLPVSLLDRKSGSIDAARSRLEAEESGLRLARRSARREMERALTRYRALRAQAELFADDPGEGGDDLLTIARAAYQEGEMDLIELTDAARARRDAVVLAIEVRSESWIGYYELVRASGSAFGDPDGNEVNP